LFFFPTFIPLPRSAPQRQNREGRKTLTLDKIKNTIFDRRKLKKTQEKMNLEFARYISRGYFAAYVTLVAVLGLVYNISAPVS
jgi:hypothetical protein